MSTGSNYKRPRGWLLGFSLEDVASVLTLGGVVFAVIGIFDGKTNILAVSRAQLYQSDYDFIKLKASNPEWKAWSIYSYADKTDATQYCETLLKVFSDDPRLYDINSAEGLYRAYSDASTFGCDPRSKDMAELRRTYSICSALLDGMHQAYDLKQNKVIDQGELETWLGYIRAIGPHPVFLTAIAHWRDSHFMTKGFAMELRRRLTCDPENPDSKNNKRIVAKFYKVMLSPEFLEGLPE
jgi:hypothetical protein